MFRPLSLLLLFATVVYGASKIPFGKKITNAEFTYYIDGGTGACGTQINPKSEMLVAVGNVYWAGLPNPNNDPICKGVCVKVEYKGKSITVPVKDKCWGCGRNKLDLSEPAFKALENLGVGRAKGASFTFVKC